MSTLDPYSKRNPQYYGGGGLYRGPFRIFLTGEANEKAINVSAGYISIGQTVFEEEADYSLTTEDEYGLDELPTSETTYLLVLRVYYDSAWKSDIKLTNANSFTQAPQDISEEGEEENIIPVYQKALGTITFKSVQVEEGEETTTKFRPIGKAQWWQAGYVDVPRIAD